MYTDYIVHTTGGCTCRTTPQMSSRPVKAGQCVGQCGASCVDAGPVVQCLPRRPSSRVRSDAGVVRVTLMMECVCADGKLGKILTHYLEIPISELR